MIKSRMDATPTTHPHLTPWSRLWSILQTEKSDLWVILVYSAAVGLLALSVPMAVQALVSTVAFGTMLQPVLVLTVIVFLFLTLSGFLATFQTWIVEVLQRRLFARVSLDIAYRLPRTKTSLFDRQSGPELVNQFFEIVTLQKTLSFLLLEGLWFLLYSVVGLVLVAFYHPLLFAYALVIILGIAFILFVLSRGAVDTSILESKEKYVVAAWLEEVARNRSVFKNLVGAGFALSETDSRVSKYIDARRDHFRIQVRQLVAFVVLQVLSGTALLGLGASLVIQRQLTLGQLVAAELIVSAIVGSIFKLRKYLEAFYDLMTATDKIGHLFDLPLDNWDGEVLPRKSEGLHINLKEVSFSFEHSAIIENLNWTIEPGACVCIFGEIGSGKSTLLEVLLRLRPPTKGVVEVDGRDLKDVQLDSFRSQAAHVNKDGIFTGSILDNICLGRDTIDSAKVRKVLDQLGILQAVDALPEGLKTKITMAGPLSEGEAQLIIIARELISDPRLIIVDEALDNLDSRSRDRVVKHLIENNTKCTVVVTTQSRELAAQFPLRYEMKEGRLVS